MLFADDRFARLWTPPDVQINRFDVPTGRCFKCDAPLQSTGKRGRPPTFACSEHRMEVHRLRAKKGTKGFLLTKYDNTRIACRHRDATKTFDMTKTEWLGAYDGRCAITNIPFNFDFKVEGTTPYPLRPSPDRIDSSIREYRADNFQWVLQCVNFLKRDMTQSNAIDLLLYLTTHQSENIT